MKIAIISYTSRQEGCLSGVERFNSLLQRAVGGEIYTGTMFKTSSPYDLNKILLNKGLINEKTLCIVDGFWGLGIPENIPVISVVHGTWTEFVYRNYGKLEVNKEQDLMWHRPNTKLIAVSNASAKYLEKHHKVKSDKVILNGVDANIFKPLNLKKPERTRPVIIHCARDFNKDGNGKLGLIKSFLYDKFDFLFLDRVEEGKEYLQYNLADIALQCSSYEGNSYFALEAMSCGLPIIVSETGLFEDMNFNLHKVGEVVSYNSSAEEFSKVIEFVYSKKSQYNSRQWILENATFELFAEQWRKVVNEYKN